MPDLANVALNEEAGNIFSKFNVGEEVGVSALDGWTARIFLGVTQASHSLVLLVLEVVADIGHVQRVWARGLVLLVVLTTLPSPTEKCVVEVL